MNKQKYQTNEDENTILARQSCGRVSFKALMKADGHKFQGRGRNRSCFCPFHSDGTPTFSINRQDTDGDCMRCQWFGDVVDYVMRFHRLDSTQTLEFLERASIVHPRVEPVRLNIPKVSGFFDAKENERLRLFLAGEGCYQRSE